MREKLAAIEGERRSFVGTFKRFGRKTGWKGREETTILLTDIKDGAGVDVADHIWFRYTKGFASLGLVGGERIAFDARSAPYWKGYGPPEEQERDFQLSFPTNIRIISQSPISELPLFANDETKRIGLSAGLLEAFEAQIAAG